MVFMTYPCLGVPKCLLTLWAHCAWNTWHGVNCHARKSTGNVASPCAIATFCILSIQGVEGGRQGTASPGPSHKCTSGLDYCWCIVYSAYYIFPTLPPSWIPSAPPQLIFYFPVLYIIFLISRLLNIFSPPR